MVNYAAELLLLKNEIQALCTMITNAVEQIKMDIVSMHPVPVPNTMETDKEQDAAPTKHHQSTHDLTSLIADLKHNIATIAIETRAMYHKHMTLQHNHPTSSSVT